MNTAERVVDFLRKNPGQVICDECLQKTLRVKSSLSKMLDVLNPLHFRRAVAHCTTCGVIRMTITHLPVASDG